ncbi:Liprin-alpha [Hondaea fermentalgiana]|uniref:Liprin-alpha n=1 Tax=Hondaea fermentalgiana TaxID=2315210 RepID=A0A2R5GAU0_9STRA|nr:Liprin-alpha [Hondaea fermentalgiana]|eukprot:GBG28132.1 Liprin-alpha [Hondaea fermentalgiana]
MGVSCSKPLAAATGTARIESQAMFWSSPMVASWLNLIGLAEYVPRFLENGVDGPTLIDLRRDQFERCLGINNPLHEVSLRLALIDLKYKLIDYTQWEWNCTGVMQWLANRGLEQLIGRFQSAAVHGSVLFRLTKAEFASRLHVGELGESELVLESLWHSVERARKIGYYLEQGNFLDWGPPEIRGWLETINLGHLHEHFREHAVNGTLLPHLDHQTLRRVMKLTEIQTMVLRTLQMAWAEAVHENDMDCSGRGDHVTTTKEVDAATGVTHCYWDRKAFDATRQATSFTSTAEPVHLRAAAAVAKWQVGYLAGA